MSADNKAGVVLHYFLYDKNWSKSHHSFLVGGVFSECTKNIGCVEFNWGMLGVREKTKTVCRASDRARLIRFTALPVVCRENGALQVVISKTRETYSEWRQRRCFNSRCERSTGLEEAPSSDDVRSCCCCCCCCICRRHWCDDARCRIAALRRASNGLGSPRLMHRVCA